MFQTGINEFGPTNVTARVDRLSATLERIRFERIAIPNGEYDRWKTFNDLYKSLVDNSEGIFPVEKMQYLKPHVVGDASRVIQHLKISNDNYIASWELLRKRCESKMSSAWNYLQKFYSLSPAKEKQTHQ